MQWSYRSNKYRLYVVFVEEEKSAFDNIKIVSSIIKMSVKVSGNIIINLIFISIYEKKYIPEIIANNRLENDVFDNWKRNEITNRVNVFDVYSLNNQHRIALCNHFIEK